MGYRWSVIKCDGFCFCAKVYKIKVSLYYFTSWLEVMADHGARMVPRSLRTIPFLSYILSLANRFLERARTGFYSVTPPSNRRLSLFPMTSWCKHFWPLYTDCSILFWVHACYQTHCSEGVGLHCSLCSLWGRSRQFQHVLVSCDNMTIIQVLHYLTSRDPAIMHLLRWLHYFLAL